MAQPNFKKVNLVPSSLQLMKKIKMGQTFAIIAAIIVVLSFTALCGYKMYQANKADKELKQIELTISEARFDELKELQAQFDLLVGSTQSGNNNVIPNINGLDMTDFLTYIVKHMPDTMKLNSIDGELSNSAEYSYSFAFSSTERGTIPTFLSNLQNEPNLRNINVSAIVSSGGSSDTITDNTVQQTANGWNFTLVVKAKADPNNQQNNTSNNTNTNNGNYTPDWNQDIDTNNQGGVS